MAKCELCNYEMETARGCGLNELTTLTDKKISRIPYGEGGETEYITEKTHPRCHDCNCEWKHQHHLGCDMEKCPLCGNQLISCGHGEVFKEFNK